MVNTESVSNITTPRNEGNSLFKDITYEDLKHFRGIRAEIKMLEELRQWIYYPVQSPNGREQIGARSEGTTSDPTASAYRKLDRIDRMIAEKMAEDADLLERIWLWVTSLPDPYIRTMVSDHYIMGMSWGRVCVKVYGFHDRQLCRKMVMRYLNLEQ